jgi:hypothetical protein
MRSAALQIPAALEIKVGNVGLVPKLDAIGAFIAAVKEAHRDEMSAECWAALGRAQDQVAHATLTRNKGITGRLDLPARRLHA